jgi:hypothetical protein
VVVVVVVVVDLGNNIFLIRASESISPGCRTQAPNKRFGGRGPNLGSNEQHSGPDGEGRDSQQAGTADGQGASKQEAERGPGRKGRRTEEDDVGFSRL